MSEAKIDTAILNAIRREFTDKILPKLDEADRYTGAMMKRALNVLWAQAASDAHPGSVLRDAGLGTPEALAARLRAERPTPSPELRAALRAFVESKLEISNPEFLAATREGTGDARS